MRPRCIPLRTPAVPAASQDGLWITDAMLHQVTERYIRFSAQCSRHLSSCPGPIESRRRLGKRHMTAIRPESHFTPPPWSMEFPLRLGEWKWEPPNTPEDRIRNNQKFSVRRRLDGFISWLENFDDQPSPADPVTEPVNPTAMVSESDTTQTYSADAYQLAMPMAVPINLLILQLNQRLEALDLETVSERAFWVACKPFYTHVQHIIQHHPISTSDFRDALQPFNSTVQERLRPEWLGRATSKMAYMYISILSEQSRFRRYSPDFRLMLVEQYKKMDKQYLETYLFFAGLAKVIHRGRKRQHTRSLVLDTVEAYIEFKAFIPPHHQSTLHNIMITSAIRYLSSQGDLSKSAMVWKIVKGRLSQRYSGPSWRRVLRQLAVVQSFYPSVTTEECLQTYCGPWTSGDAFLFAIGRLWATERFPARSTLYLTNIRLFGPDNWTRLVGVISHRQVAEQQVLFRELCWITKQTGHFEDMVRQLAIDARGNATILRKIAWASGDHTQALTLWKAARSRQSLKTLLRKWDWTDWIPYVKTMIEDPNVDLETIWRVLALNWGQPNKAQPGKARVKTQTRLLELMAKWFSEAVRLNNRETLRAIEDCLSVYRSIDKRLSRRMLNCLADVIVQDLQNGYPGRNERIRWMVGLIREHQGKEEADQALFQLRGWRWTIMNRTIPPEKPTISRLEDELKILEEEANRKILDLPPLTSTADAS